MISDHILVYFLELLLQDYIAKKPVDVKIMSGKDILDLYYEMIPGLEQHKQKSNTIEGNAESQSDEDEDNVSDSKEISSYESDHDTSLMKKAARKENKKKVKEEKREARKTKAPKTVKKRKLKKSKAPKTR
jgi:RIO kinase 1